MQLVELWVTEGGATSRRALAHQQVWPAPIRRLPCRVVTSGLADFVFGGERAAAQVAGDAVPVLSPALPKWQHRSNHEFRNIFAAVFSLRRQL